MTSRLHERRLERAKRREAFLAAHPTPIQFTDDKPMRAYNTIPTEGRGAGIKVPWYFAGFFMHPTWYSPFLEKHNLGLEFLSSNIRTLPGGSDLDDTIRIEPYYDDNRTVLVSLCDNMERDWDSIKSWLPRRDSQFKILCDVLELNEDEVEMAKRNFAWHIFKPQLYTEVPHDMTLYDPSKIELFNSITFSWESGSDDEEKQTGGNDQEEKPVVPEWKKEWHRIWMESSGDVKSAGWESEANATD